MDKINMMPESAIRFVNYSEMVNWSVRYLIRNSFEYNKKYNLVKINEFLQRNRNIITIKNNVLYSRVTIKLYNKGVQRRDIVNGENIGTKNQYLVKYGQFIISKIDARNGAFGIIPEYLDEAITTADFLSYNIDISKINPIFLKLVTSTKQFLAYCQGASSGTTGRQRINERTFLNVKIPLPPLEEQNRITEAYNKRMQFAEQQEEQANQIEQDIESYFFEVLGIEKQEEKQSKQGLQFVRYAKLSKWALSHFLKEDLFDIEEGKYKTLPLKNIIIFFKGGKTPSKGNPDFWNGEISWTSPKDFNGNFIKKSQDHITQIAVQEAGMKVFPEGIFLSVFRSGILRHSFPTAITKIKTTINQDIKAYAVNEDIINKYYFLYFIHTFKDVVLKKASKKSVTVESINTEDFMEIPIPIPPLKIQTEIAKTIRKMKNDINTLQQQAQENRKLAIEEFEKDIFQ